jgi:hypothetical protein
MVPVGLCYERLTDDGSSFNVHGSSPSVVPTGINPRRTQREVEIYQEWIANDRRHRALVAKMREVAATATELLLKKNVRRGY